MTPPATPRDLFAHAELFARIKLPDADLRYAPGIALPARPQALLRELVENVPWRQEHVVVWGKRHPQPRLVAWFGDAGRAYRYSGMTLEPLPWSKTLAMLKARIEAVAACEFNSVLLNYYRDNDDSMGLHSDDEPELGARPIIASLSFGERRDLVMKHKFRKDLQPVRIPLASGSLLIMQGDTQRFWKHAINKERRSCGARVNHTFRRIVGGNPSSPRSRISRDAPRDDAARCARFAPMGEGRLFVVSAPSGAGKTSLVNALMAREPRIQLSVSYTTRAPRPKEIPGRDYHFVSMQRFLEMQARDEFLEHAQVFDHYYGTGVHVAREALLNGEQLMLEIDWQGARQVRKRIPEARSIFILPPSRDALELRLRARSTDSDAVIQRRLRDAAEDLGHWHEFDYVVVNDDFTHAIDDLRAIVAGRGEHLAAARPEVAQFAAQLAKL